MSLWGQLSRGLPSLLRTARRDREIEDEVHHYFEEAVAACQEGGMSEGDARRSVLRSLGPPARAREASRSYGWENAVRTTIGDLRFAARQLWRYRTFAIINILTIGIGVGMSTAIFSAINPILLKPLPYPHADRILTIWNTWQGARAEIAFGTYVELTQRSHSFDFMAIYEPWQPAMIGGAEPQRLNGQSVSPAFFHVLGVAPAIGRDFRSSDAGPHKMKAVILSDGLWRQVFHGETSAIGRPLRLDGIPYTVIGVMPRRFEDVFSPSTRLWTTDEYDAAQLPRDFNNWAWGNHLRIVARLRPGIQRAKAIQELSTIARTPWPQFPRPAWATLDRGLIADSLQDDIAHVVRPALLAVGGAVVIVLMLACVNVVNLLLAQSAQRTAEFAMRGALGASQRRIVRQLVTETLLLSVLGGMLGIVLAIFGIRAIVALSPPQMPRLDAIRFDPAACLFAMALVVTIGLAAGVIPALCVSRGNLQSNLRQASSRVTATYLWTRRILAVTEIAMALTLLISASLLLRSTQRLLAVNPGFNPSHLLTLQIATWGQEFDNTPKNPAGDRARRQLFERMLAAAAHLPGVESAAFTSYLPMSDDPAVAGEYGAQFEGQDSRGGYNVFRYAVSPGYCKTMGIPLLRGRMLDEHDRAGEPQAALISESLARHHFGGRDPIGSRLHIGPRDRPWYTVVGVVGDIKQTSLALNEADAVYLPTEQTWFADDTLSFVVRIQGAAAAATPAVKSAIWSVNRNQPIVRVVTVDRLMDLAEAQRRFILVLFQVFGAVSLSLAAIGLYGVLSGTIAQRSHEIGIRMALGASRGAILRLALGDGMRLTGFGIAIGICGALIAGRALASLLFGVSALDPIAWLCVTMLQVAVAGAACWAPAWRGANVDPCRVLRGD